MVNSSSKQNQTLEGEGTKIGNCDLFIKGKQLSNDKEMLTAPKSSFKAGQISCDSQSSKLLL